MIAESQYESWNCWRVFRAIKIALVTSWTGKRRNGRGWRLTLHPDATTTAYGPHGQVIHSHGPPRGQPVTTRNRNLSH
jgi:hypothetical protein